jgi:hypothetical protein
VNPETIDSEYAQLQQQANQVNQAISGFSQKLQTAANAGNTQAQDWLLDLKSLAIQVQQEQLQTQALLQAVHDFTVSNLSGQNAQPQYVPQPTYDMRQAGAGSTLSRFMGGGFGRAILTGAGFGIGDDLINRIL